MYIYMYMYVCVIYMYVYVHVYCMCVCTCIYVHVSVHRIIPISYAHNIIHVYMASSSALGVSFLVCVLALVYNHIMQVCMCMLKHQLHHTHS